MLTVKALVLFYSVGAAALPHRHLSADDALEARFAGLERKMEAKMESMQDKMDEQQMLIEKQQDKMDQQQVLIEKQQELIHALREGSVRTRPLHLQPQLSPTCWRCLW